MIEIKPNQDFDTNLNFKRGFTGSLKRISVMISGRKMVLKFEYRTKEKEKGALVMCLLLFGVDWRLQISLCCKDLLRQHGFDVLSITML